MSALLVRIAVPLLATAALAQERDRNAQLARELEEMRRLVQELRSRTGPREERTEKAPPERKREVIETERKRIQEGIDRRFMRDSRSLLEKSRELEREGDRSRVSGDPAVQALRREVAAHDEQFFIPVRAEIDVE